MGELSPRTRSPVPPPPSRHQVFQAIGAAWQKRKWVVFTAGQASVWDQAKPPTGCLVLGKSSEPHLPHLKNRDHNTDLGGLSEG